MPYKQYPDFFNKHPLPKEFDYSAFRVSSELQRQSYQKYGEYFDDSIGRVKCINLTESGQSVRSIKWKQNHY